MLLISGSIFDNSDIDYVDNSNPLTTTSCGHYSLFKKPCFATSRPTGRKDYQLLYFKNGKGLFRHENRVYTVSEGQIFIYYPDEPQYYQYELGDSPELYWAHFTGNKVKEIFERLGIYPSRIHSVGVKDAYHNLFEKIIREMQLKQKNFETLVNTYFYQLLALMSRSLSQDIDKRTWQYEQIERAIHMFHTEFHKPFSLAGYARQCNMSVSWFARLFRRQTGVSPQQYLTNVRINKAKELLASPSYNIGEIGNMVGFHNPLYFSRIFKNHTGCSPSEYKKLHIK
ncbi:MAG: AraC family transcriptional regulator [Clostridiales bacterium]|jgi:AraC family transcriptional regulator of arabinose operon|nr:AraC family transcriptional regulator [Clostridiales bacterium]